MLAQHYLLFLVNVLGDYEFTCYNYYHSPSEFSSKIQSSMTTFDHKLLTREGRVLTNGLAQPSSMTIFAHLFFQRVIIATVNTI